MNTILKENESMHWIPKALFASQPYCDWSTYLSHSCFNRLYWVLLNKCREKFYRDVMCPCVSLGTFFRSLNVWQYFIMACMEKLTVHLKLWVGFQQLLPEQQMKNIGSHFKKYKQVQEQLKKERLSWEEGSTSEWRDRRKTFTTPSLALTTRTHMRARAHAVCSSPNHFTGC